MIHKWAFMWHTNENWLFKCGVEYIFGQGWRWNIETVAWRQKYSQLVRLTWLFDARNGTRQQHTKHNCDCLIILPPQPYIPNFVSSVDFWNHNKTPKSYHTARRYQIKTNFWQTVILPPYPYLLIWVFGEFCFHSFSLLLAHTWLMLSLNNNHHEMAVVCLNSMSSRTTSYVQFPFYHFHIEILGRVCLNNPYC